MGERASHPNPAGPMAAKAELAKTEQAKTEENVDLPTLKRLGFWGGGAVAALLLAVLAVRTDSGARRISEGFAPKIVTATETRAEPSADIKRLVESIRTLSGDRDRLLARVTVLERNLEDVTGSVTRIGTSKSESRDASGSQLVIGPSIISTISAPQTITSFPANRVANAHSAARGTAPAPESVGTVTEFGADIGGGPSIEALRNLWSSARGTHGALFDGLRPVIAVRDLRRAAEELRLIVGPLANANAAARLCASLSASGWTCRQAIFDGQRMSAR